jgi:hypothetical protein
LPSKTAAFDFFSGSGFACFLISSSLALARAAPCYETLPSGTSSMNRSGLHHEKIGLLKAVEVERELSILNEAGPAIGLDKELDRIELLTDVINPLLDLVTALD